MMVYFRKRLPESVVNDCNERIVRHGLHVIRSAESEADEDDGNDSGIPSSHQPTQPGSYNALSKQVTLLDQPALDWQLCVDVKDHLSTEVMTMRKDILIDATLTRRIAQ
jgi:hypothetical protein